MTFVIITHVPHLKVQNSYFAYAPYVREMNIWIKLADKVIIVAPKTNITTTIIDLAYNHKNIEFVTIDSFNLLSLKAIFLVIIKAPKICWRIYTSMKRADHIHLRCPGNVGLLGSFVQVLLPKKIKSVKYAGNWDPKSKQPWSYRLQKWIVSNTFLSRNMQVLVYGEWERMTRNIKPFFTATYNEEEKAPIVLKDLNGSIDFVFVGGLVKGKNPLYAVQLVAELSKKGHSVTLRLFGEGTERKIIEQYILENNLEEIISLKGNQTKETLKKAYQRSHFVVLPSDSEGWPKALAEGMFWGCVPIASSVSCVPFMLDYGKRGLLLTMNLENNVKQIGHCILDKEKYLAMSEAGHKWSQQFTLNLFEQKINNLVEN
jgi:glycosyltransferase involved in cell wall biosynthesis